MGDPSLRGVLVAHAIQIAVYTTVAFVAYLVARALRLFRIPKGRAPFPAGVPSWEHVAIAFGLYLAMQMVVLPILAHGYAGITGVAVQEAFRMGSQAYAVFSISGVVLAAAVVIGYVLWCDGCRLRPLWVTNGEAARAPGGVARDLGIGAVSLFVAYPAALAVGNFLSLVVAVAFGPQDAEQLAVDFFRSTTGDPLVFWGAILMLVVAVPVVEECLFRMMLQSWLRQLLPVRGAIVVASLVFSIFHYADAQSLANIHLLAALFLLSCFLGFVYERQRSLWAPIALHSAFNATSITTMLLFDGG